MHSITVPFAPALFKLAGLPLLMVALAALYFGQLNLRRVMRMFQGHTPVPAGSNTIFVAIGAIFWLLVIAFGLWASFFCLAIETTQPTWVGQQGIVVGAGPPFYRTRQIAWQEVKAVTCNAPPPGDRIRTLTIFAGGSVIVLGDAGASLEAVRSIAAAWAPPGVIQPCKHGAFDHQWSY